MNKTNGGRMDDNVVDLRVVSKVPMKADKVLKEAAGELETVVIVGYDKYGDYYFASSEPSGSEVVWLLEWAKKELYRVTE